MCSVGRCAAPRWSARASAHQTVVLLSLPLRVAATRVTVPRARPRGAPTVSALGVRILRIEVLPGLPEQNKAREILERYPRPPR